MVTGYYWALMGPALLLSQEEGLTTERILLHLKEPTQVYRCWYRIRHWKPSYMLVY
jgi:hypothetical protein